ncbi:hypothetical protein [Actinophytocola sediminis]
MGEIDTNGDGRIDMRIEDTAHGMGEMHAHADGLDGLLNSAFAEINSLTAKLGKGGKMSDEFMTQYRWWREGTGGQTVCVANPVSGDPNTSVRNDPGLDKSLRDVAANYRKIAEAGDNAVGQYREAEQNAVGEFRR